MKTTEESIVLMRKLLINKYLHKLSLDAEGLFDKNIIIENIYPSFVKDFNHSNFIENEIVDYPSVKLKNGNSLSLLDVMATIFSKEMMSAMLKEQMGSSSDGRSLNENEIINSLAKYTSNLPDNFQVPEEILLSQEKSFLELRFEAISNVFNFIETYIPEINVDKNKDFPLNEWLSESVYDVHNHVIDNHLFINEIKVQDRMANLLLPVLKAQNLYFDSDFKVKISPPNSLVQDQGNTFSFSDTYNISKNVGYHAFAICGPYASEKLTSLCLVDAVMNLLTTKSTDFSAKIMRKRFSSILDKTLVISKDIENNETLSAMLSFLDKLESECNKTHNFVYDSHFDYAYPKDPRDVPQKINDWAQITSSKISLIKELSNEVIHKASIKLLEKYSVVETTKSPKTRKRTTIKSHW